MTSIWTDGHRGQARMTPTEAELGQQIRRALWDFTSRTSTRGPHRDRTAVGVIRGQYPRSRGLFSDAALVAVLREPQAGTCSWCAFRMLEEEAPTPTDALHGLLGSMCSRCKIALVEAPKVAAREKALLAGGYRRRIVGAQPTGKIWVDDRPRPVAAGGPQRSVRAAIQLARQLQQRREASYQ